MLCKSQLQAALAVTLLGVLLAAQTKAHTVETTHAAAAAKELIQSHPEHTLLPPDELAQLIQGALSDAAALKYDDMADAFLCKRCGAVLFSRSDLLRWADAPPVPVNLHSVRAEPALGPDALLPVFNSAGIAGTSSMAEPGDAFMLFDLPLAIEEAPDLTTIVFKAQPEPSKQLFQGYNSFAATCGACSSSVGYFLSKEEMPGSGKPQDTKAKDAVKPSTSPTAQASPSPAPLQPRALPWKPGHLDELFQGVCHVRHTGEWWSYEVCHGSGVAQLHLDQKGQELTRWSLGSHRPNMAAERVRAPPALYDIHRFRGGQRCDETGKGRNSKVQYKCCFPTGSAQEATSGVKGSAASPHKVAPEAARAWIANVVETAMCQYTIDMCVPALCVELPKKEAKPKSSPTAPPLSSETLRTTAADASGGKNTAKDAPFRFLAMSTKAVIPDTAEELAWLSAHTLQAGSK